MFRWSGAILLTWLACGPAAAIALSKPTPVASGVLAPHRAVYEISLADRKEGVPVSDVTGRMVFELTGSPCEGYTQNIRLVTRIADEEGKETFSDLRSSTWEKGDGGRFRFTSSNYINELLQDMVSGTAVRSRNSGTVAIRLKRPNETLITAEGGVMFPTQHSLAILRSAQQGERLLRARIYDGSEQGQVVYNTVAFIGPARPGSPEAGDKAPVAGGEVGSDESVVAKSGLGRLESWPVAISYFDQAGRGDTVPSYELSFRLYPNGVSRNLLINYGDFSVRGRLDKLTYMRAAACK